MEADYSVAALLGFLDFIDSKGLANHNTVRAMKIAIEKLIGEDAAEDVRSLDLETATRRYANRNPSVLSPSSLAEYQRRVQLAIKEFTLYTQSPTTYSGFGRGVSTRIDDGERPRGKKKTGEQNANRSEEDDTSSPSALHISLAFPLRADFLAKVVVPRDLKLDEAKRLAAFIATLASDYKAQ